MTFLYKLFKIPGSLDELLEKAREEGERNIHIMTQNSFVKAYPSGPFYRNEVSINVRYFHGKEMREVTVYQVSSKSRYYNSGLRVKGIAKEIEKAGFDVKTIRKRRLDLMKKYTIN